MSLISIFFSHKETILKLKNYSLCLFQSHQWNLQSRTASCFLIMTRTCTTYYLHYWGVLPEVPPTQLYPQFSLCAAQVLASECSVSPVSKDSVPAQLFQPAPVDPPQCTAELSSQDHRLTNC